MSPSRSSAKASRPRWRSSVSANASPVDDVIDQVVRWPRPTRHITASQEMRGTSRIMNGGMRVRYMTPTSPRSGSDHPRLRYGPATRSYGTMMREGLDIPRVRLVDISTAQGGFLAPRPRIQPRRAPKRRRRVTSTRTPSPAPWNAHGETKRVGRRRKSTTWHASRPPGSRALKRPSLPYRRTGHVPSAGRRQRRQPSSATPSSPTSGLRRPHAGGRRRNSVEEAAPAERSRPEDAHLESPRDALPPRARQPSRDVKQLKSEARRDAERVRKGGCSLDTPLGPTSIFSGGEALRPDGLTCPIRTLRHAVTRSGRGIPLRGMLPVHAGVTEPWAFVRNRNTGTGSLWAVHSERRAASRPGLVI